MKNLASLFFTFSILFLGFTACSDSDSENGKSNPIKRVEASTKIDLSKYDRFICHVNGEEYDYTIINNSVTATPKEGGKVAYTYPYDPEMMGGSSGVYLQLASGELLSWGMNKQIDQSTFADLTHFDALIAEAGGNQPSVIKGLKIRHQFSMLSFTVKDLPQDAIVSVRSQTNNISIKPYITESKVYQCIPNLALKYHVSIKVDDKEYSTQNIYDAIIIKNRAVLRDSNNFYEFEVIYNADAEKDEEKLAIQNGTIKQWVNQHFAQK